MQQLHFPKPQQAKVSKSQTSNSVIPGQILFLKYKFLWQNKKSKHTNTPSEIWHKEFRWVKQGPLTFVLKENHTEVSNLFLGLLQWLSSKESTCKAGDAGDMSLIPGSGRSPGGGHDNRLQYSCLENPTDRSLVDCSP